MKRVTSIKWFFLFLLFTAGLWTIDYGLSQAGQLKFEDVPVDITSADGEDIVIAPGSRGNTQIGVGTGSASHATSQNDLHITGVVESDGAAYMDSTATIAGNLSANANVTLGDSSSDTITATARLASNLIPSTDATYELGSSSIAFSKAYSNTLGSVGAALALSPASGYSLTGSVTKSAATGDEVAYNLAATANKATSGNYTGLKLNVTETSAPGALDKLMDLQVGGTSWLKVSNGANSANYGLLSLGSGAFDGSTSGYYVGSSSGNILAINAASGFTGNLLDLQVAGSSKIYVDYVGNLVAAGSQTYSGGVTIGGDLAVNGGDITTTATTFNLLNATATTINFGGAATTLELGATTGTTSVNNSLAVDGNTTLGNGTDNVTVNTDQLYVEGSSGNVGIGTTAPKGVLHVGSSQSTPPLFVTSLTGNVGIGTTGPQAGLHIKDLSADTTFQIEDAQTNTSMRILNTSAGGAQFDIGVGGTGGEQPGSLYIFEGGATTRFVIKSGGNVGIGTTSPNGIFEIGTSGSATPAFHVVSTSGNVGIGKTGPAQKLDVNGIVAATGISSSGTIAFSGLTASKPVFTDASSNLVSTGTLGVDQGGTGVGTFTKGILVSPGTTTAFTTVAGTADGYLLKWSSSYPSTSSSIFDNGSNIGIGTTAPTASLQVSTTANQDLFSVEDNGAGDTTPFIIKADGNVGIGTTAPVGVLHVGSSQSTPRLFVASLTGNVGIGTTGPKANLHVGIGATNPTYALAVGDAYIESDLEVKATAYMDGPVVMGGAMSVVSAITQTNASGANAFGGNINPTATNTYSLGNASAKWADLYATTTHIGDINFANSFKMTEVVTADGKDAIAFVSNEGVKIMVIDSAGDLYVRGEVKKLEDNIKFKDFQQIN